jgi:hypothetical protein
MVVDLTEVEPPAVELMTPEPTATNLNRRITCSSAANSQPNALRVSAYSVMLHAFRAVTSDVKSQSQLQRLRAFLIIRTELQALVKNRTWNAINLEASPLQGRCHLGAK